MATQGGQARGLSPRRVQWVGELLLIIALYVAYEFARGLHRGTDSTADTMGKRFLHWEQVLHIDPEKWLTVGLDHHTWLAVPTAYFYSTMHYIVTPVVLVWLYLKHRSVYGPARTWLGLSTLVALVMFYFIPTAPPRLLHMGFPDVLADVDRYGWWSDKGSAPQGLGHLTNQYAAMPSMHVGWALWCGFMLWRYASRIWVRLLGVVYPMATTMVVLSTGNHYLLDVIGGALVMAAGALVSLALTRGRRRWSSRRRQERRSVDGTVRDSGAVHYRAGTQVGQHGERESATSTT